jgi:DNA-binding transcriptional ArsR family regulator
MNDPLSTTFAALADPTRRAMLAQLSKGDANVSDLAKPFLKEMSLPAVTKHLKVLEKAGLITKTRDAQWRPCKLNGDRLKDVANWMEQYRIFWEESFDRLEEYLKTVTTTEKAKGKKNGRKKRNE